MPCVDVPQLTRTNSQCEDKEAEELSTFRHVLRTLDFDGLWLCFVLTGGAAYVLSFTA